MTLIALAVAQYHWINDISRMQRQRAVASLGTVLSGLKTEFDLEITRAYAVFLLPASQTGDYAMGYMEWLRLAPYLKIILGVYVVAKDGSGITLRPLIPGETMLDSTSWKRDVDQLTLPFGQPATPLSPAGGASAVVRLADLRVNLDISIADNPAFVFPTVSRLTVPRTGLLSIPGNLALRSPSRPELMPSAFGPGPTLRTGASLIQNSPTHGQWAVVVFDAAYITATLLPEMLRTRLPSGPPSEYRISVISNRGPTHGRALFRSASTDAHTEADHTDGKIDVFQPRLDCLLQLADSDPLPASNKSSGRPRLSELLTSRPLPCADSPVSSNNAAQSLWTLQVAYRSGTLDYVMAAFRRRNIVFSSGVLLVLAAAIATLIVLTKRAAVLAQMQTDFVLGISHELRAPLTVIRVAADNLQKGMAGNTEQAHKYGQIITQQATELSNMIEDTLALARIQPGRHVRTRAPVSCRDILNSSLAYWDRHLRDAGFDVATDIPSDLPLVDADSQLFTRCIENLIQNALKYASSGRWLRIRARMADERRGDCVEISIEDRGPGISPSDLPHIFEPFYRGKHGPVSDVAGIGLGLTLVKRVIEAHGGVVEVTDSGDSGAVFSLFLPCYHGTVNADNPC
jgi:signal transduction histidine kinase